MKKKKAYFVGISGKTPSALAKALRDQGWEVSGSDHEGIYPPASTYLDENRITCNLGYQEKNVPSDADFVMIGRGALLFDQNNPEYLQAKRLKLPVFSLPESLNKYVNKKESIVVAGTYGKTTTTALIAWILIKAGLNPSYGIGGEPINMKDAVKITNSSFSVIEGDETPSLLEKDPPKFSFYHLKYLLITATKWDHPEVYKTDDDYLKAFIDLTSRIPFRGILVFQLDNVDEKATSLFKGKKVSYSFDNQSADYFIKDIQRQEEVTVFQVCNGKKRYRFQTTLLGNHNLENICGAVALCLKIGIKPEIISRAVGSFKGVKTRLELVGKFKGRIFYWDLAQHPEKIRGSLEALRNHFPKQRIIAVFDPEATTLKFRESLVWYPGVFDSVDQAIVGQVSFLKRVFKKDRVSGLDIIKAVRKTQKNVTYQPKDGKIYNYLTQETKPGDVIIFMSSGGLRFTNLIEKVVNFFKK